MSNKILESKMQEILKIIEKNDFPLENLNISQLELINEYYIGKIAEYEKKLA